MKQNDFLGLKLSELGFGAMRLPLTGSDRNSPIDEDAVNEMLLYAHEHGINYYDTAYLYHGGQSEYVTSRILKQFPRDSYYLATKFPGHYISESYNPEEIFEDQLKKCDVEFFDFYLLHNVYENSIGTYTDPRWGIIDYLMEQKKNGRIRHFGFSSHGQMDNLRQFLNQYGDVMEFCQIQLNYLDWSLQDGKAKYELLTEMNIPVWVMEPVRGGTLVDIPDRLVKILEAARPHESVASWGFRWLQTLPNVKLIISGMSNMDQLADNVKTFSTDDPLSPDEIGLLKKVSSEMRDLIPCTSCRYCCEECPQKLDIPTLLGLYNEALVSSAVTISMRLDAMRADERPDACTVCGACSKMCPQGIDIPTSMKAFTEASAKLPSWAEICRQSSLD